MLNKAVARRTLIRKAPFDVFISPRPKPRQQNPCPNSREKFGPSAAPIAAPGSNRRENHRRPQLWSEFIGIMVAIHTLQDSEKILF
jgi:hypothetical protein